MDDAYGSIMSELGALENELLQTAAEPVRAEKKTQPPDQSGSAMAAGPPGTFAQDPVYKQDPWAEAASALPGAQSEQPMVTPSLAPSPVLPPTNVNPPWDPQLMAQMMMNQMQMMNQMMGQAGGLPQPPPPPLGTSGPATAAIPYHAMMPGQQLPQMQFEKLVGPPPAAVDSWQWNRWYDGDKGDKEQVPKWDGKNPAKMLKPWLRDLRLWRQETSVPVNKHGLKLFRSFDSQSWLKQAADRIPEEKLTTAEAWELILREILGNLKPYLDVENEVLIEETLFMVTRDNHESMSNYVTRKINKRRELDAALGKQKIECTFCSKSFTVPKDIPDEIWSYLLKRGAKLSEEQRKLLHQWETGVATGKRLMELLLRLDRTDTLVAQTVAASASSDKKNYMGLTSDREASSSQLPVSGSVQGPEGKSGPALPSSLTALLQNQSEDNMIIDDAEEEDSEDEYDMTMFDDDGLPLTDEQGNTLVPFEPDKEYGEEEAIYLCAFAGSYREVRGALQATRVGRDQKVVKKSFLKSKPPFKKKPFFKPGQAPKRSFPDRSTPYKDKVGGKPTRGPTSDLLKKTKCFKCGKMGHMQRQCTSTEGGKGGKSMGSASGSKHFFQFQSTPAANLFTGLTVSSEPPELQQFSNTECSTFTTQNDMLASATAQGCIRMIAYPSIFAGLSTSPCHALVDSGAQDGVIGLWHWQRWAICLAKCHGCQPVFYPLPHIETGGIGGAAKAIAICDMPTGLAGLNGITRWAILDEKDPGQRVPPLISIKLLKLLDAVHEPKCKKLTLRDAGVTVLLEELPSEHQTMSLMQFAPDGWSLSEELTQEYGADPFVIDSDLLPNAIVPTDQRLSVPHLVARYSEFIDSDVLESLGNQHNQDIPSCSDSPEPASSGLAFPVQGEIQGGRDLPAQLSLVPSFLSSAQRAKTVTWPKDEWKKGPGCWIRVHNRPRRALFTPTGTQDGPNISMLSGSRTTSIMLCHNQGHEVIGDDWTKSENRIIKQRWTGSTTFQLQKQGSESGSARYPAVKEPNDLFGPLVSPLLNALFAKQPEPFNEMCENATPTTQGKDKYESNPFESYNPDVDPEEAILSHRTKIALHPHLIDVFPAQELISQENPTALSGNHEHPCPQVDADSRRPSRDAEVEDASGLGNPHADTTCAPPLETLPNYGDNSNGSRVNWIDQSKSGIDARSQRERSLCEIHSSSWNPREVGLGCEGEALETHAQAAGCEGQETQPQHGQKVDDGARRLLPCGNESNTWWPKQHALDYMSDMWNALGLGVRHNDTGNVGIGGNRCVDGHGIGRPTTVHALPEDYASGDAEVTPISEQHCIDERVVLGMPHSELHASISNLDDQDKAAYAAPEDITELPAIRPIAVGIGSVVCDRGGVRERGGSSSEDAPRHLHDVQAARSDRRASDSADIRSSSPARTASSSAVGRRTHCRIEPLVTLDKLPESTRECVRSKFGNHNLVVAKTPLLPDGIGAYLGTVPVSQSDLSHFGSVPAFQDRCPDVACTDSQSQLHVYKPYSQVAHDDLFMTENATLGKADKSDIACSLGQYFGTDEMQEKLSGHKAFVPTADGKGEFNEVDLHVLADQQIHDMSQGFDFSKPEDRSFSLKVLEESPKLLILNLFQDTFRSNNDREIHCRWVTNLALRQYNQNLGFVVIKEDIDPLWESCRVRHIRELPDVEYLPVEACKHGLICQDDQIISGVLTNVSEITNSFVSSSDSLKKKRGKNVLSQGQSNRGILKDVLRDLKHKGWLSVRNAGTTIESFMTEATHDTTVRSNRVADAWIDWLTREEVCTFDLTGHYYLTENYPYEEPEEGTSVTAPELVDSSLGGEDLDEEMTPTFADDYKEPTEKQKRELFKIHRGVGHPPPNDFGRALRNAGVHRHLIRWAVKELRCPVCEGRVRPAAKRPGALPRCLKFNQVIGADLFEFPDSGFDKIVLNVICWGTGYQQACVLTDKRSETVRNAIASLWIKHYGWPHLMVTDQGPEFVGHEFATYVGENGCLQHYIDSQSPWQQGRTERAGDSLKEDIRDVLEQCAITLDAEFDLALTQAIDARNRYVNRSGFSAHQRVYGSSLRLPGSLMSDDPVDRLAVAADPSTEFQRSAQIRDAAQRALFKHADHQAIDRASRARSRAIPKQDIKTGDTVYVWRNSIRTDRKIKGWVGPGLVVCINENGTSVWVSMRGVLVKCNVDRVRLATDSEFLGAELIKILSADAREHIARNGQRGYVDASREDGPEDDDPEPPNSSSVDFGPLSSIPEESEVTPEPTVGNGPGLEVPVVGNGTGPIAVVGTGTEVGTPVTPRRGRGRPRLTDEERMVRQRTTSSASATQSEPASEPHAAPSEIDPMQDETTLRDAAEQATARAAASGSASSSSSSAIPAGGWIRAAERARPSPYGTGFSQSIYLTSTTPLMNSFNSFVDASRDGHKAGLQEDIPAHDGGVTADKCCIALDENTNELWVMLQSTDASGVEYRNLTPKERKVFDQSRHTEMKNLFDLGAYRILSVEESLRFREMFPDCVLPSRWVERWKATDEGGVKAKSRVVILGFKDPHVLQLERSSPTPTNEAFTSVMQIMASTRCSAWSSDIKNAFGQSRKTTRTQPIAASLPPGMLEAGFNLDPRQLLLCETEVYGLISGPSWLRQSLVADLEDMGYVKNPYDKCIFSLPPKSGSASVTNHGTVLIEVDDLLEGGDEVHRKRMETFYAKYQCGKRKKLQDLGDEGTLISGIRVIQKADFSFVWHMNEYSDKAMSYIDIPRGYLTQTKEIDDKRLSEVISCNGKIGWLGGNGRPDVAAGHSIIAGEYKTKSPTLITSCNQCVKQAKENKVEMKIWSIPVTELRFVGFCDSSFDFSGVRHQQGWIIGFTNKYLNQNKRAPISIALWRSRKLPRKAGSPQLVETYAASYCCADMNWVRCMFYSALYADFDVFTQRPRHFALISREPTVLRTDRPEVIDPEASLLSDSKGLYDALNNELPQDDKKSAVEMPIIEQMLRRMGGRSRWIPHNFNPSDGLTKLKGAHMAPMMDLLKTGFYHLMCEDAQLKQRAQQKVELGHTQRHKQK